MRVVCAKVSLAPQHVKNQITMAELSDDQLREELKVLTGKDSGPILPTTRPLLIKKLLRLQEGKVSAGSKSVTKATRKVGAPSPSPTTSSRSRKSLSSAVGAQASFGFSSDEDKEDREVSGGGDVSSSRSNRLGKKTTQQRKSTTASTSPGRLSQKGHSASRVKETPHSETIVNGTSSKAKLSKVPSEEQLNLLTNDEIQTRLLDLTGTRYPISDATKSLHVKKLRNLLSKGAVSNSKVAARSDPNSSSSPMETQFSESDDDDHHHIADDQEAELMEFESSPEVSVYRPPKMVNQSVNTSSFLDLTLPDPPSHDPDRFVETPISDTGAPDDEQVANGQLPDLPPKLPSPNLSSTRRSFVPASAVSSPAFTFVKPVEPKPSPPRSVYARRPLRTSTNFVHLNEDVTPKPTSRFAVATGHVSQTSGSVSTHFMKRDYTTRYSTGGGAVIDPKPEKKERVAKDLDMMVRDKGKHSSYWYSKSLVVGLCVFLVIVVSLYIYLRMTAPVPLGENLISTGSNNCCQVCLDRGIRMH